MMSDTLEVELPKKDKVINKNFQQYLDNESRYLILYGGGGSGKSYFVAERFVLKLCMENKYNLLVVRNTGKSNRDSTYALFKQVIRKWQLNNCFKCNESDLRIRNTINGNEIIFAGLDDVEKLKSITFSKGELTTIWIEEATEIQESDFNQLDIRLRGKGTKKQMVLTFNPIDINHWIKRRFFDKKDENVTICKSTYLDNNFLDDDYKNLLESYKDTDPYYYNVYCLGNWGVLGKTVFDARKLSDRLQVIPKPIKTGFFSYDYDGLKITNIKWVNDENGYIKIYKAPNLSKYCIGGDTAGEGSDYFTGHVIDVSSGEQVAVLRHEFDADIYAKQMYCLGTYYNKALVGIESNFDSFPIRELQRLGYDHQYIRESIDSATGQYEKKYGFRTTSLTRPTIISNLIEIVREDTDKINDRETIEELLTIIRNEKGRIEAPIGGHDDLMMGLAIAYHVRSQVSINQEVVVTPYNRYNFSFEKPTPEDYGEKVEVV